MTKTVIFDLDGTLADCSHRQRYVRTQPRNWDAFTKACVLDTPNLPVVGLMTSLKNEGFRIVICSGRSDDVMPETIDWLMEHTNFDPVEKCEPEYGRVLEHGDQLYMRKAGDYRCDTIVKKEMLDKLIADGHSIEFVVDDRNKVVDMWRANGLVCLQCAPGDF